MSCNCAVNKDIEELYRRFGHKVKAGVKKTAFFKINEGLKTFAMGLILLYMIPLMFGNLFVEVCKGNNKISLTKYFNLSKIDMDSYVRKQQELQDKY